MVCSVYLLLVLFRGASVQLNAIDPHRGSGGAGVARNKENDSQRTKSEPMAHTR